MKITTETSQPQRKKDRKSQRNKGLHDFARYSGVAFQMFAIIFIAVWGGMKLDKITGTEKPVFTIILSLLGVIAAIYTVVKDFIR